MSTREAPPRGLTQSGDGAFSDLRYLILAALVAAVVAQAHAPPKSWVVVALVVAAPDLARRHDLTPEILTFGLAALLYASTAWSLDPELSAQLGRLQLALAALFVAVRVAVTGRRAMLLIGWGYLVGCILLLWDLLNQNPTAQIGFQVDETTRYTIEGVNQNYIAYTMAGGVAVALLLAKVSRRWRFLAAGAAVPCAVAIPLTGTRGALVAVVVTVVWWFVPARHRVVGFKVLLAVVGVAALVIVTGVADERIKGLVPRNFGRDAADPTGRLDIWPIARATFWEHPWLGDGAGSISHHTPHAVYAHDVILDVGTSAGIAGVAVLLATLYAILFRGTRGLTDTPQRYLLIGVAICATAPPLLTGYWYQSAPLWIVLALFSRMGVAVRPAVPGSDEMAHDVDAARV